MIIIGIKSTLLLSGNGLEVLAHEKLGSDASIIFQLMNAYLYKVTEHWNKYLKLLFTFCVMSWINLKGLLASALSPKNPDLFLDHVVLVRKPS